MKVSKSAYLFDVNVLVALMDAGHVHNQVSHDWFELHRDSEWATCPLTETGFIRVMSTPSLQTGPITPTHATQLLKLATAQGNHRFLPDSLSVLENSDMMQLVQGPRQVTDAYLVALCKKHQLILVTLDHKISSLIPKGSNQVEFI